MEFVRIVAPVQSVSVAAKLDLSESLDVALTTVLKAGSLGPLRRGKVLHLGAGLPTNDGFNFIDFDLVPQAKAKAGTRKVVVFIGQHQHAVPLTKSLTNSLVPGQMEAVKQVLALLEQQVPPARGTCNVSWEYLSSQIEAVIPLPFPIPIVTTSEMNLVNGVRLVNGAGTQSVIIDKGEDSTRLFVSARFPATVKFGQDMLQQVLMQGGTLVKDLIAERAGRER